jgi:hypothetical protein
MINYDNCDMKIKADPNRPTCLHCVSLNSAFYITLKNTNNHRKSYLITTVCNISKVYIYCQIKQEKTQWL